MIDFCRPRKLHPILGETLPCLSINPVRCFLRVHFAFRSFDSAVRFMVCAVTPSASRGAEANGLNFRNGFCLSLLAVVCGATSPPVSRHPPRKTYRQARD